MRGEGIFHKVGAGQNAGLVYHWHYALAVGLTLLGRAQVIGVCSAKSPGVAGLGVDDEYGVRVITSGATLVLPGAVVIAGRCANGQHQAEAEQKANNKIREVDVWAVSLLFGFHNYSSLDFAVHSFSFIDGHKYTV